VPPRLRHARPPVPCSASSALVCLRLSRHFGSTKSNASLTSGRLLLTWNKIKLAKAVAVCLIWGACSLLGRGGVLLPCLMLAARAAELPTSGPSASAWLCVTSALLYTAKPGSALASGSPQGGLPRGCAGSASGGHGTLAVFRVSSRFEMGGKSRATDPAPRAPAPRARPVRTCCDPSLFTCRAEADHLAEYCRVVDGDLWGLSEESGHAHSWLQLQPYCSE